MNSIIFARKWGDGDRKYIWSGTPNSLYNAFKKVGITNIHDVEIKYNLIEKLIVKCIRGLLNILSVDGCEWPEKILEGKIIDRKVSRLDNMPTIVFSECNTSKLENTYIYIDCSVSYAYRCSVNNLHTRKYVPLAQRRRVSLLKQRCKYAEKFYRNCKGIFTMGSWCAEDLIMNASIPVNKVHAVGGGCNLDISKIDESQKKGNKFLFVGKDFERKNGPLVIDAFKLLKEREPKAELYIAGPVDISGYGELPDGVEFLGLKNYEELIEYYNLCDFFVMPSKFEAYGLVFAEALIYGLPCIGKNAFAMPEFIEHGKNGFLINNDDEAELAEAMYNLLHRSDIVYFVAQNKQNYIKQYSWESVAKRMVSVFERDKN